MALRAPDHRLKKPEVIGAKEALQASQTVRVVEFEVGGETHQVVTRPSAHAARALKALGIKVGKPPCPAKAPAADVVQEGKRRPRRANNLRD